MFETERLIIRRFTSEDAKDVYECCNDFEVVKTTLGMPWPYTEEMAESWISKQPKREESGLSYEFAICFKENPDKIIGCVSLMEINSRAKRGEMGYWVARKYWKQGIATEILNIMIQNGVKNGITAFTLEVRESNQAARLLYEKTGFKFVGIRKNFYSDKENACIYWLYT